MITQNNQKAIVKQGTKIPVQTIVNNTVSVQFVDAVLQLDVTPQITAEGTIYMDVNVDNDQIDHPFRASKAFRPSTRRKRIRNVLIADGGTVVIGGIIVTQQRTDIRPGACAWQLAGDRQPVQAHHRQLDLVRNCSSS